MRQLRVAGERALAEALDSLAHAFTAESGIRVHVRSSGHPALSPSQGDDVFGPPPKLMLTEATLTPPANVMF